MEKYYKILEINTNATEQEVKQAYRDLVKVWHPDRFAHDIKLQRKAEEKLKEINEAYQRIIDHLNNSHNRQQSRQYQRTENQENTAEQPPPKQPHNSWVCPECLRTNYIYNLTCGCGFKTNEMEMRTYRADQTSADLYDAILFNRNMNYTGRAEYLEIYLLKRFPKSKEADILRQTPSGTSTNTKHVKPNKSSHFKKNWGTIVLIKALWRGDIPLYKTFWLFGFAVNLLLNITFVYFEFQTQILSTTMGIIVFGMLVLFAVIYGPFILIATWRSANKYRGLQRYAILAKFMVIFGWGRYFQSLGEIVKMFTE